MSFPCSCPSAPSCQASPRIPRCRAGRRDLKRQPESVGIASERSKLLFACPARRPPSMAEAVKSLPVLLRWMNCSSSSSDAGIVALLLRALRAMSATLPADHPGRVDRGQQPRRSPFSCAPPPAPPPVLQATQTPRSAGRRRSERSTPRHRSRCVSCGRGGGRHFEGREVVVDERVRCGSAPARRRCISSGAGPHRPPPRRDRDDRADALAPPSTA